MSTLRNPPSAPESSQPLVPPPSGEPRAIVLEREVLRDVTRLVAERAALEAEIARTRTAHDTATDRDYQEKRKALDDRFLGMNAAELHEDATRRRGIIDGSIAAEASAKDEFARASRKIASEFDAAREQARSDHAKSRAKAVADFDSGEKQASIQHSTARKPVDDATKLIESRKARLADLYERYQHACEIVASASRLPVEDLGQHAKADLTGVTLLEKVGFNDKTVLGETMQADWRVAVTAAVFCTGVWLTCIETNAQPIPRGVGGAR